MSKKYYEQYWQEKKLVPGSHLEWKSNLLSKLKLKGKSFLDIGCGDGQMAAPFLKTFRVYGTDISEKALYEAADKGIITTLSDANSDRLAYEDEFFDVVSCLDVLEHLLDPEDYLEEISRVLAPGGRLIVCVPNILNIFNRLYFVLGEFTDVMDVAHKNGELFSEHIKLFSKAKLETLLSKKDFIITERQYYFPKSFTEEKWRRFQILGDIINAMRIPQIFPSLFALGFLYVCQKRR